MNDRSTPTFDVAVHQAGAGGGPGPEVAHGFLLSTQTVMVPQPPETLSSPWQRLVVRITRSADPAPDPGPETINVAGLALSAVATDGVTAAAALLTLNKPSRHTDALREHDRRDLTEARRAVVRERTRIARELHDIVANAVAVMVMRAEDARSTTPAEQTGTIEAFGHIEDVGRSAMTELRRMLRVLRSPDAPVEDIGRHGLADLQPRLEDGRRTGIGIDLDVRGTPLPLDDSVDRTAYRLVQEAVTNITKHAGPGSHAAVRITWSDALHIEVVDDGAGRTLAVRRDLSTGHGLIGLAERIAVFGGELTAGPHRSGFRVAATLPISPTPGAGAPAPAVTGGGLRQRGGL
ncbi:histidine kinase [Kitasatospora sp. NPDC050463]|uniref:sensor histidine kinase n=1 Tax=Kitasatospora sp. NPDC050463 TaxID=3155786 RepID=UPI0033E3C395